MVVVIVALLFMIVCSVTVVSLRDTRTPEERQSQRWELERQREAHRKEHEQWDSERRIDEDRRRKEQQAHREEERKEAEQRRKEIQEEHKREQELQDKIDAERELRKYRNSGMYWDRPQAEHCVAYGTRELYYI